MIYLVSLVCPNGHPNGGMPREYASDCPPEPWLDTLCRDLWREVKKDRENWSKCAFCGVPLSNNWGLSVSSMKAQTMDEAKRDLASISTPE